MILILFLLFITLMCHESSQPVLNAIERQRSQFRSFKEDVTANRRRWTYSGHKTRNQRHTPVGSTYKGFKMTELDDYVSQRDHHYEWVDTGDRFETDDVTVYVLYLTSQKYLDETIVTHPIWTHFLYVIVPKTGVLYGGRKARIYNSEYNIDELPPQDDFELLLNMVIAAETQTIGCVLFQNPNEPIAFMDDMVNRTEDGIIAYTWVKYMENPEENARYLLRLPMVKAVVRAMDATEEFIKKNFRKRIRDWSVSGASKRGWTTWMVGAYDGAHEQRVFAISPYAFSFINMHEQIHHWWKALGGWSFALYDYYVEGVTTMLDTVGFQKMLKLEDPYRYRERFTQMYLYQVQSSNDQFFMLDDPLYYFNGLTFKKKYLLIIPNSEHSLSTVTEVLGESSIAFYNAIFAGIELPEMSFWRDANTGDLDVFFDTEPSQVTLNHAHNLLEVPDFRWTTLYDPCPTETIVEGFCYQDFEWVEDPIEETSPLRYHVHMESEDEFYEGFYIQGHFNQWIETTKYDLIFSSFASIVPAALPFDDCSEETCFGELF